MSILKRYSRFCYRTAAELKELGLQQLKRQREKIENQQEATNHKKYGAGDRRQIRWQTKDEVLIKKLIRKIEE